MRGLGQGEGDPADGTQGAVRRENPDWRTDYPGQIPTTLNYTDGLHGRPRVTPAVRHFGLSSTGLEAHYTPGASIAADEPARIHTQRLHKERAKQFADPDVVVAAYEEAVTRTFIAADIFGQVVLDGKGPEVTTRRMSDDELVGRVAGILGSMIAIARDPTTERRQIGNSDMGNQPPTPI